MLRVVHERRRSSGTHRTFPDDLHIRDLLEQSALEISGDDNGKRSEDYKECLNNNCRRLGTFVRKHRPNCRGACLNPNLNSLHVFENHWEKESNDGMVF